MSFCGDLIEEFDCVDISVETDRAIMIKLGTCEGCHNNFQWNEYYTYNGYGYPELVEKDEEY